MNLDRKTFLRGMGAGALGWLAGPMLRGADGRPALPSAGDPSYWRAVRQNYRFAEGLRYFNTGGLGPAALPVRAAVDATTAELQDKVETGHHYFVELKSAVADFLGASSPEEVCFVRNATEGNGMIAGGLDLRAGDEVIIESHAHPGGSFPWLLQARQRGVVVKLFDPMGATATELVERIQAVATERTKVVQVSHVTAPTGIHMPAAEIARLCRDRGWWFHVDGAQTAGMFPFSVSELGIDSYATSGHKWLGAPHETGLLYVKASRMREIVPPLIGAYSGELERLPGELVLSPTSWRFEYGTRNAALAVGVGAAMTFQNEIGRDRIAARGRELAQRFRAGLADVPDMEVISPTEPRLQTPIVTIRTPRIGYGELFGKLMSGHHMRCRPVSEQGLDALRISLHLFNLEEDVDALLAAIDKTVRAA